MATTTYIPVQEYLATSYRPDCDYIDGEVRERNLGEQPHALIQTAFAFLLKLHSKEWGIRVLTEQRVQTSAKHFRIPDVCILQSDASSAGIVRQAPLLCIEVLSPNDTLASIQERIDDYTQMGVKHIWVADPLSRRAWTTTAQGLLPVSSELEIPGTPIRLSLSEIFAELDEIEARP